MVRTLVLVSFSLQAWSGTIVEAVNLFNAKNAIDTVAATVGYMLFRVGWSEDGGRACRATVGYHLDTKKDFKLNYEYRHNAKSYGSRRRMFQFNYNLIGRNLQKQRCLAQM